MIIDNMIYYIKVTGKYNNTNTYAIWKWDMDTDYAMLVNYAMVVKTTLYDKNSPWNTMSEIKSKLHVLYNTLSFNHDVLTLEEVVLECL